MDKQIIEMAKVIKNCSTEMVISAAERLYNEGYRNCKDKVVLSNEEYSALLSELKRLVERVDRISCGYVLKEEARKEMAVNRGAKNDKDTYKRLTKKGGYTKDLDLKQELGYSYIYTRLSELEDKIEIGQAVILPCDVGDQIYVIFQDYAHKNDYAIFKEKVDEIRIMKKDIYICLSCGEEFHEERNANQFGVTLFITKEAAEAKLKELRKEQK